MSENNIEHMKKLIEEKKQKSASQQTAKRGEATLGTARGGMKKFKKGGLFDK